MFSNKMNKDELVIDFLGKIIALMGDNANDERLIVPLFKTLEFSFEFDQLTKQGESIKTQIVKILELGFKETKGSKSIAKVIAFFICFKHH